MPGEEVPRVNFNDAVIGEAVPKAPFLALSFTARNDESLPESGVFTFVFEGTPTEAELVTQRCFDADGAEIDAAGVSFGG